MTDELELSVLSEEDHLDTVAVLSRVFGPGHHLDWFKWKHLENPAGSSIGWVARVQGRLVGVRLFLRWVLELEGEPIRAVRPVDTATVPEARGSGVFRRLTEHALGELEQDDSLDLIFNTPNASSRPGYVKMGWSVLPPIAHCYTVSRPARVRRVTIRDGVGFALIGGRGYPAGAGTSSLETRRSPEFLSWRYDQRSGNSYHLSSIESAGTITELVFRIVRRRSVRIMVVCDIWGESGRFSELVYGSARTVGAQLVLFAGGPGSADVGLRCLVKRGSSVLAVRPVGTTLVDTTDINAWSLRLGDLERVI